MMISEQLQTVHFRKALTKVFMLTAPSLKKKKRFNNKKSYISLKNTKI